MFALVVMNRGYVYNLGFDHEAYALNVPLNLEKTDLRVSETDADIYRRVVQLTASHLGDGRLVAGPDCPEVYFLTGQFSQSGSLFDFFSHDISAEEGVSNIPAWNSASVIVLNHQPSFSLGLSQPLVVRIRELFPNSATAGHFEVRWR